MAAAVFLQTRVRPTHGGLAVLGPREGPAGAERCSSLDRHQGGLLAAGGALQASASAGHRAPLRLGPLHHTCTHR